jgi:hypothetical protein
MGELCFMHISYEKGIQKNLRRDHLEEPGVDGKTVLIWILKKIPLENVDWIH